MVNKQDFLNAFNQNIEMVRGDTLSFNFEITGLGEDRPDFTFTCAEIETDSAYFTATLGDGITLEEYDEDTDTALYSVVIVPAKTAGLDLARYAYDLQLESEDVITLLRGYLTLLNDVTR